MIHYFLLVRCEVIDLLLLGLACLALFLFINVMRLLAVREGPHCVVAVITVLLCNYRNRLLANAGFCLFLFFKKKIPLHNLTIILFCSEIKRI